MKTFCLLLFGLIYNFTVLAQTEVDSAINKKIKALRKEGIKTIITYYSYCNGAIKFVDSKDTSCQADDIKYLIWSKNHISYLQRFDDCKQYAAIIIDSSFVKIVEHDFIKLKNEKIYQPSYTYLKNGKRVNATISIDHSCHTVFDFNIDRLNFTKNIDHYDLGGKYIDGKYRNVSYWHNEHSIQNNLKHKMELLIKKYSH